MEYAVETDSYHNQMVCTVRTEGEALGFLVIDSIVEGRAHGGLRIGLDVNEGLVSMLARTMTLKYGFAGLPLGGAKAGIVGDPEAPLDQRRRSLVAFAAGIHPLLTNRIYVPAADMATNNADIRYMLQQTQVPIKARQWSFDRSGYFTGTSIAAAAKAASSHKGLEISECSIAIEGYGKVGRSAAFHLDRAGAKVVAVSTLHGAIYNPKGLDLPLLENQFSLHGSHFVEHFQEADHMDSSDLLELEVDILSPCAAHHTIRLDNASRIRAAIITPGANNPLTTEAENDLSQRGVLCVPDFVANCGGATGTLMQIAHMNVDKIDHMIDELLRHKIGQLLKNAEASSANLRTQAELMAKDTMRRNQLRSRSQGVARRIFQVGLEFNRRGWLPGALVSRLAEPYFVRKLTG